LSLAIHCAACINAHLFVARNIPSCLDGEAQEYLRQEGGVLSGLIIAVNATTHQHRVEFHHEKVPPADIDDIDLVVRNLRVILLILCS